MDIYPELDDLSEEVKEILKPFLIPEDLFEIILCRFKNAMNRGLGQEDFLSSPVKMLPTFVTMTPTGKEKGRYFALDLGGTNLRFLSLDVERKVIQTESRSFQVPQAIMRGECNELFDYIATCLEEGLRCANGLDTFIENIGVTFSFPIKQNSLTSGTLLRWCKGFDVKNVVGKDVGFLLIQAFQKRKLEIGKVVLINDTTGTLMSAAFYDQDVKIGMIVGTGTNACYVEKMSNIREYSNVRLYPDTIIVNTEWGSFGEKNELDEILTDIDKLVDARSVHPHEHVFEKLIAGLYVGEICRELLIKLITVKAIFEGVFPAKIYQPDVFSGQILSDAYDSEKLKKYLKKTIEVDANHHDCHIINTACAYVSLRAAKLASAGLITLINRINRERITIAGDGSMFKMHPMFTRYLKTFIQTYLPHKLFKIITSDDGSGIGAALAAATQYAEREYQSYADEYQFCYE